MGERRVRHRGWVAGGFAGVRLAGVGFASDRERVGRGGSLSPPSRSIIAIIACSPSPTSKTLTLADLSRKSSSLAANHLHRLLAVAGSPPSENPNPSQPFIPTHRENQRRLPPNPPPLLVQPSPPNLPPPPRSQITTTHRHLPLLAVITLPHLRQVPSPCIWVMSYEDDEEFWGFYF